MLRIPNPDARVEFIEAAMRLLEIDESNIRGLTEIAKVYRGQGRLNDAEASLTKVLDRRRNDLNARTELAKIYQRQGKLNEAATIAEQILAFDPVNDFAMSELLGVWNRQGEKEKCKKSLHAPQNNIQHINLLIS